MTVIRRRKKQVQDLSQPKKKSIFVFRLSERKTMEKKGNQKEKKQQQQQQQITIG